MKTSNLGKTKIVFLLFFFSFLTYFLGWLILYRFGINEILVQSEDAVPATYLPVSILREQSFNLDEFYNFFRKTWPDGDNPKAKPYYLAYSKDNHIVSYFPVMSAVLAVPFYLPSIFIKIKPSSELIPIMGRIAASFFVACSAVFVYLSANSFLNKKSAFVIFISYAFGTISWGLSSQSLWQHGPSQALLSMSIYFLIRGLRDSKFIKYAGLSLSLATLVRPTGFIPALLITIYVFYFFRKELIKFLFLAFLPTLFQFWYNYTYFGSPFFQAYQSQGLKNWTGKFPEGFFGLWLSPSKGLLAYSPIFLFSLFGIYLVWKGEGVFKDKATSFLFKVFSIISILFTVLMGRWVHWYGGWGFGYRMVVDITPFLILFLIPVFQKYSWKTLRFLYIPALLWSILVEISGIVFDFRHWHTLYDNGPIDTGWLWSIKNSEMAYYLRRALRKFSH